MFLYICIYICCFTIFYYDSRFVGFFYPAARIRPSPLAYTDSEITSFTHSKNTKVSRPSGHLQQVQDIFYNKRIKCQSVEIRFSIRPLTGIVTISYYHVSMWCAQHITTTNTTFGVCLTRLFLWRSLRLRSGPPEELLEIAGARFSAG